MTVTWSETQPAGNANKAWRCCNMSSDGSKMLAGVNGGRLYLYSGGSWSETQPAGIVLNASETAKLSPGNYQYDIQILRSAGTPVSTLTYGEFVVPADVTRATS